MYRGFEYVTKEHKKHAEQTFLPIRKTKSSAGYDLLSPITFTLKPKETKVVWMDVKVKMPGNEFLGIYIRSSLGIKHQISIMNGTGIIDSDYYSNPSNDGNIGVALKNNGKEEITINQGEGIAQGIFMQYLVADNCNAEATRSGGIGSTN